MKLSKRLEALIEEHDIDEGEQLLKVMLDPDSTLDDMETSIYAFLVELPDYDPDTEYLTVTYIQDNLLEDDDDDSDEDEDEDEDWVDTSAYLDLLNDDDDDEDES